MRFKRGGFTLIELLVVIIIIAILAAVAAPIMRNIKERAIASEAIVALGCIWTAQRDYYQEYGAMTSDKRNLGTRLNLRKNGMARSDIDGTYFSEEAYSLTYDDNNIPGELDGMGRVPRRSRPEYAPQADVVRNLWNRNSAGKKYYIFMLRDGSICSNIKSLGYPTIDQNWDIPLPDIGDLPGE